MKKIHIKKLIKTIATKISTNQKNNSKSKKIQDINSTEFSAVAGGPQIINHPPT
jgi:hypothetical protein